MKKHQKNLTKIITTSQELFDLMSSTESGSGQITEEVAQELIAKMESFKFSPEGIAEKRINDEEFKQKLIKKMKNKLLGKEKKLKLDKNTKKLLEEKFKDYLKKKNE